MKNKITFEIQNFLLYLILINIYLWNLAWTFNYTSLMWAVQNNHMEVFQLLLEQKGIDINCKDIWMQNHSWYSIPTFLCYWNLKLYIKFQLQHFYMTPLILTASHGRTQMAKFLLAQEGIDINNSNIWTQNHLSNSKISIFVYCI